MPSSANQIVKHARGLLAIEWAKLGFRIFPLIPGAKTPAHKKWHLIATTDITTIIAWWNERDYNIGIATGPAPYLNGRGANGSTHSAQDSVASLTIVVIDYDCKPGQLGADALKLHTLLGHADTRTSKTPNGTHKFYVIDASTKIPNSQSKLAMHVDIRGYHGYVVAPGSTVDGVDYKWVDESEMAQFPAEFVEVLSKQPLDHSHDKRPIGELDRPESIETVKLFLKNDAAEAIQGAHGDATTFQVAARVKDLGVSEQVALDLMLEFWNDDKASPPWAFDALRTKVSNAYQYGENPPGSKDPLNEFPLVPNDVLFGKRDTKDLTIKPAAPWAWLDYAADNALVTTQRVLVHDLLRQHELSAVFGQSGTGKSFAALDIAYSVATGQTWNGHAVEQGLVVYVAAEGQAGIGKRLAALRQQRPASPGAPGARIALAVIREAINLFLTSGDDNDANRMMRAIREIEAEQGQPVALIVFDTLSRVLAGADENSSVDMGKFIKNIGLIMRATGAHVLMVHHAGKDIAKGSRGWSGIKAALDTEIEIHEHRLSITKQREIDQLDPIRFRLRQVTIGTDKDGQDVTSCVVEWGSAAEPIIEQQTPIETETMAAVIEALAATGRTWVNSEDVLTASGVQLGALDAEARDKKLDMMGKRLRQLEKDGHLAKGAGRGTFKLA